MNVIWGLAGRTPNCWLADPGKEEAVQGKADGTVAVSAPIREVISGAKAYVIAPATHSYKQKGVTYDEVSQMTFVLVKGKAGWKIAAWTWTGPEGVPRK